MRTVRKEYKYTPGAAEKSTNSGLLNDAQRDFYEKNGFIVIPQLIPHDLLDECRQRFLDIVEGRVEKGWIIHFQGFKSHFYCFFCIIKVVLR